MNDAISELRKRGKKKSKIEQLLLVDHSNIYFENERLAERLAKLLDELHKDKHRQEMLRNIEIQELKREIDSLQAMKEASSAQTKKFLQSLENYYTGLSAIPKPEKKVRPHTTGSYFKKSRAKSEEREAAEKPKIRTRAHSANKHEDSGSENEFERATKRERKEKRAAKDDNKNNDTPQGEKKPKKLKYPEDWYTTVLPASDNCLKKVRQQYRREQTVPTFSVSKNSKKKSEKSKESTSAKPHPSTAIGQRGQSREKTADMKQRAQSNAPQGGDRKSSTATAGGKSDIEEQMESKSRIKLMCQQKAKPVLMSLRQMRELTGMDGNNDGMPNKRQEKLDHQIQETKVKFVSLTQRVKTFVKELDAKIAQDLEDTKPKELESHHNDMYAGILPPDQIEVPS